LDDSSKAAVHISEPLLLCFCGIVRTSSSGFAAMRERILERFEGSRTSIHFADGQFLEDSTQKMLPRLRKALNQGPCLPSIFSTECNTPRFCKPRAWSATRSRLERGLRRAGTRRAAPRTAAIARAHAGSSRRRALALLDTRRG
jgi:hypothetical protein